MADQQHNEKGSGPVVIRRKPSQPAQAESPTAEAATEPAAEAATAPAEAAQPAPAPRAEAPKTVADESNLDFASLLGEGGGFGEDVEQGDLVSGKIVAISGEYAFIDLGGKTEGIMELQDLRDGDGNVTKSVGDLLKNVFVVSTRGGEVRLSLKLGASIRDVDGILSAKETGLPVQGRVTGTNKGGYEVRIGNKRAFCPISQMETGFTEDPEIHVNQVYDFKVIEADEKGKRIVVSRAALQREKAIELKEELLAGIDSGLILDGTVRSVQDYGAFVDIGGVEGLVHVSELSWKRVEHPSEVLNVGDQVQVKVLSVKKTDKGERISLSVREVEPHPWIQVGTHFVEGESYDGTVTRLAEFGAFVEIGPGVEGLIHVSEMSWERRINHANEVLEQGQKVRVYLKSIDHERKRIALSLKALEDNPWAGVREKYPVGSKVTGKVEKVENFGVFVELEAGVTALLPASESNTGQGTNLRREFKIGAELTATVLNVEPNRRRISLSLKSAAEAEGRADMQAYFKEQKESQQSGFGTLGDLFANRLKK